MEDASKPKKEAPETPAEKVKDEPVEEPQQEQDVQSEDTKESEDIGEETAEKPEAEETSEEPETEEEIEEKTEEKPAEVKETEKPSKQEKPEKAEVKKEKPKKDRGPDFKYIVRLSNTDVDGEKKVVYGLSSIKGVGVHMASFIINETDIDRNMRIGDLKDAQIEKLQEAINNIIENAPGWMLNHRKDYETGEDIHLVGSDIDMRLRDEINIMKKIRSYRGIRHERGLPARGQRTRANNRKGLTLGVSKKREQPSTPK